MAEGSLKKTAKPAKTEFAMTTKYFSDLINAFL